MARFFSHFLLKYLEKYEPFFEALLIVDVFVGN